MGCIPRRRTPSGGPRSYLINGFNDYYLEFLHTENRALPVPENVIRLPSDTIIFGEKKTESGHFYMDAFDGDDRDQIERSRHSANAKKNSRSGGSNYTLADGSARFIKYRGGLYPLNLWTDPELVCLVYDALADLSVHLRRFAHTSRW